jgi:putative zinc finger/helix-turn-helix YgiT family protein
MARNVIKPISYPIRCIECGRKEVRPAVVRQEVQKNHDGRLYQLTIEQLPVNRCEACGEIYFTNESDDAISAELRAKLNLLTPEEIRTNIETLGMQQKDLAECLGVAPETMSRWINGSMIQSRAMDNLMRAYFGSPDVRAKLTGASMNPDFGRMVKTRLEPIAVRGN